MSMMNNLFLPQPSQTLGLFPNHQSITTIPKLEDLISLWGFALRSLIVESVPGCMQLFFLSWVACFALSVWILSLVGLLCSPTVTGLLG